MVEKRAIVIIMEFEGGEELTLDKHTTLDIQRNGKRLNINATNTEGDLAFSAVYDKILEFLGKSETFSLTISISGSGAAAFGGIVADYHLNAAREILTFGQKQSDESVE